MSSPTPARTVMVVPTYNEAENLAWIVGRLRAAAPQVDVLVVDDASPDGTGALADDLAAADPQVHVLHRAGKEGLGAAYLAGFAHALDAGFDLVGEMDADGSHQPEQLPRLLAAVTDGENPADLVIGSRWVRGGSVQNWPWHRRLLSVGGNLYVRLLLGISVRDATAGFRLYRRATLEAIDLPGVRSTGYVFQTDLVVRTLHAGLTVREVPIDFVERERGDSKMTGSVALESLWRITGWGLQDRWARARGAHRPLPEQVGR
ncbi:polyprenol monophosphomannose synthase [Nocardioides bruguierae]|uniref:Polyprenol monophosphomannose synthase n=1 Tax=Nocardioides bruguierae TaxID=2945102 RepID=A0A9X2D4A8_9ACTN|nr:polyprenol monophosphomannose synthase [Nocardioides bruguierae]MCL8025890.1 polyprenol monophosphomannose synthase [Nocardioides bruguierae]MCM0619005.1 polyprenol monophosphomannose synthase [Nocardioides bruguierae]